MTNENGSTGHQPQVSASESIQVPDFEVVRQKELEEIVHRREQAFRRDVDPQQAGKDLVGLSLSGGGVRSAALSLGLLQTFHRRGVLPFIDYLSTVSGGGYAGAYLSSVALRASRMRSPNDAKPARPHTAVDSDKPHDDQLFPIAAGPNDRQNQRMLDFIFGGRYLRKTWIFFNRYLIGLLLIWTVVISGLVAAASFTAWTFRQLDSLHTREFIAALGFENDVTLAFFPAFVLLVLWFSTWLISYFKYGPRATGKVARVLFYCMVFATLVAVAALIGNGEINLSSLLGQTEDTRQAGAQKVTTVQRTLHFAMLSAVAAALLPYLSPRRLLRSGTAPKNTFEKYSFWVATRALAYGVPFVLVAYFARENISGWNERRDGRLTLYEIRDWSRTSPLWRPAVQRVGPDELGSIWRVPKNPARSASPVMVALQSAGRPKETGNSIVHQGQSQNDQKHHVCVACRPDDQFLKRLRGGFELQERLAREAVRHELRQMNDPERNIVIEGEDYLRDATMGLAERWWYLIELCGDSAFRKGSATDDPLYLNWTSRRALRKARKRMIDLVNVSLSCPKLYETLLPAAHFPSAAGQNDAPFSEPQTRTTSLVATTSPIPGVAKTQSEEVVTDGIPALFRRVQSAHPVGEKVEQFGARLTALRAKAATLCQTRGQPGDNSRHPSTESAPSLEQTIDRQIDLEKWTREIRAVNRSLLKACFGDLISDKSVVYSYTVLDKDQATRLRWFFWSFGIFLVASLVVDLNATSWHGFYARRIGKAWIEKVPGLGRTIPLAQLETTSVGRPYHLISGAVQLFGRRRLKSDHLRDRFLFSKLYCGSDRLAYVRTEEYMNGKYSLDDAIAVSGAAVSPVQTANPLVISLLTLANVRLGQWIANPAYYPRLPRWMQTVSRLWPVTPLRALLGMLRVAEDRRFCFVTDGGHHENLGIEPLLKRRCRLIIASDASQDGDYAFADFVELVRWARAKHGIVFEPVDNATDPLKLDALVPLQLRVRPNRERAAAKGQDGPPDRDAEGEGKWQWSEKHLLKFRIKYPRNVSEPASIGYLVYMKSSLNGDEPLELRQFQKDHPDFPHSPTADQFYDPDHFESYRQLGAHIADTACDRLGDRLSDHIATMTADDFIDHFVGHADPEAGIDEDQAEQLKDQVEQLIEKARTGSTKQREQARTELRGLGARLLVALPSLLRAWCDERDDIWLRKTVDEILLDKHPQAALPRLLDLVPGPSKQPLSVRRAAFWFLREYVMEHRISDWQGLSKVMVQAAGDPHKAVRAEAVEILKLIPEPSKEVRQAIKQAAKSGGSTASARPRKRSKP